MVILCINLDSILCLPIATFNKPAKVFRHLWMGALRASEKSSCERKHPTQKPTILMRWILEKFSEKGQVICDPFMGSGTTGVACKELNRNFIGIEINKEYFDIAQKRIANTQESMF